MSRMRKYITWTCQRCGREFQSRNDYKPRFCSGTCILPDGRSRFTAAIKKTDDGCWMWSVPSDRYGTIRVDGRTVKAHRYSWELAHGAIPSGMSVLHKCDRPLCVNPDHLFLGSQRDNVRDMASKGRGWFRSIELANGSRMSLTEICEWMGVSVGMVRQRVGTLGWTLGRAIAAPKNTKGLRRASA